MCAFSSIRSTKMLDVKVKNRYVKHRQEIKIDITISIRQKIIYIETIVSSGHTMRRIDYIYMY